MPPTAAPRAAASLTGLPPEWTVLHDVAWPGRAPAVIDHVLVGPAGVFVVLTRTSGRRRTPQAGVTAARAAAQAVAGTVPFVPRHQVRAVLCTGAATDPPEPVDDVMVVGSARLATTLLSHPGFLPPDHVTALGVALRAELETADRPRGSVASVTSARASRGPGTAGRARGTGWGVVRAGALAAVVVALASQTPLLRGPVAWVAGAVSPSGSGERVAARDLTADDATADAALAPAAPGSPTSPVSPDAGVTAEEGTEPAGEVEASPVDATQAPSAEPSTVAGEVDVVTPDDEPTATTEEPRRGSGAGLGGGRPGSPSLPRGGGSVTPVRTPVTGADFDRLVALLGAGDPAGMLTHVVGLLVAGGLPSGVSAGDVLLPGGRCLQDDRTGVAAAVGLDGRREVVVLQRGTCDRRTEVARLARPLGAVRSDFDVVSGDRDLGRAVAALLTSR